VGVSSIEYFHSLTTQTGADGGMTATKEQRFQSANSLAQDLVLLQSLNIRDPIKA